MIEWIKTNLATIIICVILAVIVAAIIVNLIKKKKNNECSCGCSGCPMNGSCRKK